jgi:hypothetical protein
MGRRTASSHLMSEKPKLPPAHEIWTKCLEVAKREPRAELTDDRPAIRAALREARMKRTKLVRSVLP